MRTIIAAMVIGLLIVAAAVVHWLGASSHSKKHEISGIDNNVNIGTAGNYDNNNVNYTTIMIEKSEIARNRHVIRLCTG